MTNNDNVMDRLLAASSARWPDVYTQEAISRIEKACEDKMILGAGELAFCVRRELLREAYRACSSCSDCELCKNRRGQAVFADGCANARVFVIGEGPGQYEQRTLVPFTSFHELYASRCWLKCANRFNCFPEEAMAEGRRLPEIECGFQPIEETQTRERAYNPPGAKPNTVAHYLNEAMLGVFSRNCWNAVRSLIDKPKRTSDVYITNVIKCRSTDDAGADANPTPKSMEACRKWLDIQLSIVQPRVVVAVGRYAAAFVKGTAPDKLRITQLHGKLVEVNERISQLPASVKYVGYSVHPSYISHQNGSEKGEAVLAGMKELFKGVAEKCELK